MPNPLHTCLAIMALVFAGNCYADSPDAAHQFVVQFEFDSDVVNKQKFMVSHF